MKAASRRARATTPPTTPPAIAPVCLWDCEIDRLLVLEDDAAAPVAVEEVVPELGPVGGGRMVWLEAGWRAEEEAWLFVVTEKEFGLGEFDEADEEGSDVVALALAD